jgi:hypothetical protein
LGLFISPEKKRGRRKARREKERVLMMEKKQVQRQGFACASPMTRMVRLVVILLRLIRGCQIARKEGISVEIPSL